MSAGNLKEWWMRIFKCRKVWKFFGKVKRDGKNMVTEEHEPRMECPENIYNCTLFVSDCIAGGARHYGKRGQMHKKNTIEDIHIEEVEEGLHIL